MPDRLVRLPAAAPTHIESLVMTRALPAGAAPRGGDTLAARPDDRWLRTYQRDVPVDVLTAVVDGELTFGRLDDAAVGRAAVTTAPDGTRWVGVSAVRVAEDRRRRGHARTLCEALLAWGAARGATRAYVAGRRRQRRRRCALRVDGLRRPAPAALRRRTRAVTVERS